MRHIAFDNYGTPEVLYVAESDKPSAGPGQVLIQVSHAGVNFAEVMFRRGQIPVDLPHTPGLEVVGTVAGLGDGVDSVQVGDRVAALTLAGGGQAEYAVADARFITPLIGTLAGLDDALAAAVLCNGTTAIGAIELAGRPQRGDRVLVTAAAGGVGSCLIERLADRGYTLVAATSNPAKLSGQQRSRVQEVISYDDIASAEPFDVAFDSVGGPARRALRDKMTVLGRHVIMGDAAQDDTKIACDSTWFGCSGVIGYNLGAIAYGKPDLFSSHMHAALTQALAGPAAPHYTLVKPEEIGWVHAQLEERSSRGKFVLVW